MTPVTNIINKVASFGIGKYGEGNVDLYNRPQYKHEDGSVSTTYSRSFQEGDKVLLLPGVSQSGSLLDIQGTLDEYKKTGQYLGRFKTEQKANRYVEQLHLQQARIYGNKR